MGNFILVAILSPIFKKCSNLDKLKRYAKSKVSIIHKTE